jgi:cyclopropane fatty-acyl-phospholipid synthase-like methyltransferase
LSVRMRWKYKKTSLSWDFPDDKFRAHGKETVSQNREHLTWTAPNFFNNVYESITLIYLECFRLNKSSPAQQLWAQELIEKLGLSGDERVIDVGCGDGRMTAAIAEKVPQGVVTGIDSSAEGMQIRFSLSV